MTTTTAPAPTRHSSALGSKDRNKTAIAAALGTSVENYDFIAYGTARPSTSAPCSSPKTTPSWARCSRSPRSRSDS